MLSYEWDISRLSHPLVLTLICPRKMLIVIKSCGMTTVPSEPDHSTRINTVRQLVKFYWAIPQLPKPLFEFTRERVKKRTPLDSTHPILHCT